MFRQVTVEGLRGRQKRAEARAFNVRMPDVLHKLIKDEARGRAESEGGQRNMNREIVDALFQQYKEALTDEEITDCEAFIQGL